MEVVEYLPDHVIFSCKRLGGRLRVRPDAYIDHNGRMITGRYNTSQNTQFPTNLRVEGRQFLVPAINVRARVPNRDGEMAIFYSVTKRDAIRIFVPVLPRDASIAHYGSTEDCCCVCMAATVDTVFLPCGHLATCRVCSDELKARGNLKCPLCRVCVNETVLWG